MKIQKRFDELKVVRAQNDFRYGWIVWIDSDKEPEVHTPRFHGDTIDEALEKAEKYITGDLLVRDK